MRGTNKNTETAYTPILVSLDILRTKICPGVGRDTISKMCDDAGATVKLGRKKYCNVAKFQQYIDSISGNDPDNWKVSDFSNNT